MHDERLLTPKEVAARLRVSDAKARDLIKTGTIASIQFSERVVRVPESALFTGKSAGGASAQPSAPDPAPAPATPVPSIPVPAMPIPPIPFTHARKSEGS